MWLKWVDRNDGVCLLLSDSHTDRPRKGKPQKKKDRRANPSSSNTRHTELCGLNLLNCCDSLVRRHTPKTSLAQSRGDRDRDTTVTPSQYTCFRPHVLQHEPSPCHRSSSHSKLATVLCTVSLRSHRSGSWRTTWLCSHAPAMHQNFGPWR